MRPQFDLRAPLAAAAGAGALATAIAFAVTPATAAQSETRGAPATTPTAVTAQAGSLKGYAVKTNVVAGRRALVRGSLRPAAAGRTVLLQRRSARGWRTVARDRTDAKGRFAIGLRPRRTGSSALRVRFRGDEQVLPAKDRAGRLNVYRQAFASWYGPGLYGNRLGCGGTLQPGTVGVAHKSLPCGAKLTLRYRGRIVRTKVIDRGPYVGGREFDLTAATKRRLGFGSTGYVQVTR